MDAYVPVYMVSYPCRLNPSSVSNEGILLITENWADMSAFNWHGTAMCTEVLKLMS
jgi:hypothetical protein